MSKIDTLPSLDQILEGMRQLSEGEQRILASTVLTDPKLEAFIEELDDSLTCERVAEEGLVEPFTPPEVDTE